MPILCLHTFKAAQLIMAHFFFLAVTDSTIMTDYNRLENNRERTQEIIARFYTPISKTIFSIFPFEFNDTLYDESAM